MSSVTWQKFVTTTAAKLNSSLAQLRMLLVNLVDPLAPSITAGITHMRHFHLSGPPWPLSLISPWPGLPGASSTHLLLVLSSL
jgi:hypothetical protein